MSPTASTWLLAHTAVARDELWSTWGRDPLALVAVAAFALAYANGVLAARHRTAMAAVVRRRALAGAAGVAVLLVALASPLDAAATSLFSAHMVQHLLLTVVAAPLLALAAPVATIRRGLPAPVHQPVGRAHRALRLGAGARRWWPLPATLLALATLSIWHVPSLYGAALRSDLVHGLEHATLLASALVFWSAVLGTARRRQVLWAPAALALGAIHGGALGALLALSPTPWYDLHAAGAASWGIDPLADQQVAGAIMWVPTAAVHLGAMAVLLLRWLRTGDGRPSGAGTTPAARPTGAAASAAP